MIKNNAASKKSIKPEDISIALRIENTINPITNKTIEFVPAFFVVGKVQHFLDSACNLDI
jgi:hypothetical protein